MKQYTSNELVQPIPGKLYKPFDANKLFTPSARGGPIKNAPYMFLYTKNINTYFNEYYFLYKNKTVITILRKSDIFLFFMVLK